MKRKFLLIMAFVLAYTFCASTELFSQVTSTLNKGSVYYMVKPGNVDDVDVLLDQEVINDLETAGYEVTQTYPGDGGAINAMELNGADVVIIGRNISSGDFKLADEWADLDVPVIMLSGYVVRSSILGYLNTTSVKREATEAVETNKDRVTMAKVEDVSDYAFQNIEVENEKIGWMTWFYDYLAYGVDSFATTNNGKVLASIVDADTTAANGNVLMARWEPGVETYDGSGITPKSYRTYLQMGADDKSDPKKINYAQYTDASFQVLVNEINFLIRTYQNVHYYVKDGNVDDDDVLYDQQVLDDLEAAGYTNITQTYTGDGGAINIPELNSTDLIILGRNVNSGDFTSAEDWAEVEAPVLILSSWLVRNNRLKLLNSSSVKREIGNAVETNKDRVTNALIADEADSAFIGVELTNGKMGWMTWFYDYLAYGIDSFATTNNGKLLASVVDADTARANGNVLMVRWEAGVETYPGSETTPKGYRTYLQMGADDSSDPKNRNYAQYTDASFKVILNEMNLLAGTMPGKVMEEISSDAKLTAITVSVGSLDPAFSPDVTTYNVELPEGTTDVPVVEATKSNESATVEIVDATELPGTTTIRVTAQDQVTVETYLITFKVAGSGDTEEGVVEPGVGTLDEAVMLASDGDTLILENGAKYDILSSLVIDKELVIIAKDIPELPALDNMPVISNMFTSTSVFNLSANCNLTLIGIDVDGLGGSFIFDPMSDSDHTVNLYVNRCRLHNTTDDIFNDDGSYTNNITLGNVWVRNSFMYDSGNGHGIYTKNFNTNGSVWKFDNITMWNLGQQFTWIRVYGEGLTQELVFDHITGYNLSTSADNKELFGNDEKAADDGKASLDIDFKNNILHTQASDNDGLIFKNSDGFHDIKIHHNVLFEVGAIVNTEVLTVNDNMEDTDPQFADPENGDFTVGNADLYTAADDGEIVGALYWHPDFVDTFEDVATGINDLIADDRNAANVTVYPNPFSSEINITANLLMKNSISVSVYNMSGQLVKSNSFGTTPAGKHTFTLNVDNLESGIYFYQVVTNKVISTGKIVKR